MSLVEHFIEISNWPTSRKAALLSGIVFAAHLIAWPITHVIAARLPILDSILLDHFFAVWICGIAVVLLISLALACSGREGRWTAYLFVLIYVPFIVEMIYMFGSASTVLFAFVPAAVLLLALYYDERVAWFACLYMLLLLVCLYVLESTAALPYAPLLSDRLIDSQRNGLWFALNYYGTLQTFILCLIIATFVVSARRLQDRRLREAHQQLEQSNKLIRRYVPSQVADAIMAGLDETVDTHARRKLTLFFSDLVGFTDIAEQLEPEDLSKVLNEYFTEMTAIAQRYDGTVDELSGDAILVFFGAPHITNDKDHALRAVRMAIDMQAAVQTLNAKWQVDGIDAAFKVRMGINTGVATVGNFGSAGRTKYAALGRSVNLAARLQAHSEPGKVLLSHATWLLVNDQTPCASKGELQLKGIHKPVMAYELCGLA